jgi:uncharacterized spore protein YtfJ
MGMGGHSSKGETASSGGGLRIDPVAFLVLKGDDVRVLPVEKGQSALAKIADLTPDVLALILKSVKNETTKAEKQK